MGSPRAHMLPLSPIIKAVFPLRGVDMPHNGISTYRNAFQVSKTTCRAAKPQNGWEKQRRKKRIPQFRNRQNALQGRNCRCTQNIPLRRASPAPADGQIHTRASPNPQRSALFFHEISHSCPHCPPGYPQFAAALPPAPVHITCLQDARPPTRPSAATRRRNRTARRRLRC